MFKFFSKKKKENKAILSLVHISGEISIFFIDLDREKKTFEGFCEEFEMHWKEYVDFCNDSDSDGRQRNVFYEINDIYIRFNDFSSFQIMRYAND